jgi:recombinational DNA repair protein RecT
VHDIQITITYRLAVYTTRAAGDYISLSDHCVYQGDFYREAGLKEDVPGVSKRITSDTVP